MNPRQEPAPFLDRIGPQYPTMFLAMEDDEFKTLLISYGWSEVAADSEVEELREFRARLETRREPDIDLEDASSDNPVVAALIRKRRRNAAS